MCLKNKGDLYISFDHSLCYCGVKKGHYLRWRLITHNEKKSKFSITVRSRRQRLLSDCLFAITLSCNNLITYRVAIQVYVYTIYKCSSQSQCGFDSAHLSQRLE